MSIIRWFFSKTVREAVATRRHVWKLLQHQRDLLKPASVEAVEKSLDSVRDALRSGAGKVALKTEMIRLEESANTMLKPYPHAGWRENIEVLLVALAVAMGIRTFFLQPFKIPTGSMQPTLFGITSDRLAPDFKLPSGWERFRETCAGNAYVQYFADADGRLERIEPPVGIGRFGSIFRIYQKFTFAGKTHTFWFPPDCGSVDLLTRAGIQIGQSFKRGQPVFNLLVRSGDHLFVDRVSYNFRAPTRGETVVFETKGVNLLPQDQFYIKRLVALGGEKVQIGNDRHLRINGRRLDASTPHFEFVYSFDPRTPPQDSHYSGHVNQAVATSLGITYPLAPNFPNESEEFSVPDRHFMVMGDNTMNSFDSRGWGAFLAKNVIGKSCFVYWPLSARFGWGQR